MFLEAAGVRVDRVHCTMQASTLAANGRILKHRITRAQFVMKDADLERLGHERASLVRLARHGHLPSLKDSVAAFLGVDLPKEEQASDWGAESLSPSQIAYAAIDALAVWRLKSAVFREFDAQTDVYRTQIAATPAIARMQLRGIRFDTVAHAALMRTFAQDRAEAAKALVEKCGEATLAYRTDAGIEAFVRAAAPDEYDAWPRCKPKTLKASKKRPETLKPGKLRTTKDVLMPRADLPGVRAFMDLRRIDKRIESFGPSLAACVTAATGRIHAGYRVAGTKAGRSSCRDPNIQQTPQDPEFRALYVAGEGGKLIDADYANMEARAFAELSGDARMLEIFADPQGDLHASTALSFIGRQGVAHKHDVSPDERKQAKTTNFAVIYGGGAGALLKQAKINGRKLSREEAEDWIAAFESAYSEAIAWRNAYVEKCVRRDYVVIGKDA
jgi:DNA polymerase I-like protein with 3'-5' exonuclease and polymerase domains